MEKLNTKYVGKRVGQHLKELRVEYKITQEELEMMTGIRYQHISRIERGLNEPSRSTVMAILRAIFESKPEEYKKNLEICEMLIKSYKMWEKTHNGDK